MIKLIATIFFFTFATIANAQNPVPRSGEYTATSSIMELFGEAPAQAFDEIIPVNHPIEWEIYVPGNYNLEIPAGIMVFINSRNTGEIPDEWKDIMDRNNLIWIGANESGNDISVPLRITYALLAPKLLGNSYAINTERVYISGFSGGSRVSSMVATEYNYLFKGAIYNSGANFWGEEAQSRYEDMINNHYVFITGTDDFNLEDTKNVYSDYKQIGINNSKLMVIQDMEHKRPDAGALEAAIKYLDSRISRLNIDTGN